jgi:MYXO-CTERM domain-containing protein
MNMKRIGGPIGLAFSIALVTFLGTGAAWAQDCERSRDCPDNHYCERSGSVTCPPGEECVEMVSSSCEAVPDGIVQCARQGDCPAHLTCMAPPSGGACTSSSDGEEDCEEPEPDPDARMFCIFVPAECMANDDCAENFICEEAACGLSSPECIGEDCPEPVEEEDPCAGRPGQCVPDRIDCADDAACPGDWRCTEIGRSGCDEVGVTSGGDASAGGVPSPPADEGEEGEGDSPEPEDTPPEADPAPEGEGEGGAPPEDDPAPREPAPPEDDDCEEEIERICLPPSLATYFTAIGGAENDRSSSGGVGINEDGEQAGGGGRASGAPAGGDGDLDAAGCGCHASADGPGLASLALLALLAFLPLGWRRRRR